MGPWRRPGRPAAGDRSDSTICQVHGKQKQAAGYGYTRVLGYHPLLATRAGTGEVLLSRMRRGSASTARGVDRFVDELVGVINRAGATGPRFVRADSGFWSWKMIDRLDAHQVGWSITVRLHKSMQQAIAEVDEDSWVDIDYTLGGRAQVAETIYVSGTGRRQRRVRLIVLRTRLTEKSQAKLWPDWRHHAFITSDTDIGMIQADETCHRSGVSMHVRGVVNTEFRGPTGPQSPTKGAGYEAT